MSAPTRVVALGGGTGLPMVLRGLRRLVPPGDRTALTAIVTMSDDGGSSGRLRRSMGVPPPGDVRNCLVALSEDEHLLAGLFQHRYGTCSELGGHSVGNLILAALAEQTGSFLRAVEVSSDVLRTVGRILPATQDDVVLEARLDDGSVIAGETRIAACGRPVREIRLAPEGVRAAPGVVESIRAADLVVLGPGSLYTSLLPNLVLPEVSSALRETRAAIVMVGNLVSARGEAPDLGLADHVRVIDQHAGAQIVDAVLANGAPIEPDILARYHAEGASPLCWGPDAPERPLVLRRPLLAPGPKLRHDPQATADGLLAIWSALAWPTAAGRPA